MTDYTPVRTCSDDQYGRACKFSINGVLAASVSQDVTNATDSKLLAPIVKSPLLGAQFNPDFVQGFGEALQQAASIMREWAQDTGKSYKEVLPQ